MVLYLVEFFPAFTRRLAYKHGVGECVVGDGLGSAVEEQPCVQPLGYDSEREHLAEWSVDLERRACLFNPLTGEKEILEVV